MALDPASSKKSVYRRGIDAVKKRSGLTPLRYVFTMRPTCIEQIPGNINQVVLEWKGSGSKLTYTQVQASNSHGIAVFDDTLNMTTTLYKHDQGFEPKEYSLKVMEVQEMKKLGRRLDKTVCIAQYKMDFTNFTRLSLEPSAEEEIEVELRGPRGVRCVLHAFVKAVLLKNWTPDADSRSELSTMTTPMAGDDDDFWDDDVGDYPSGPLPEDSRSGGLEGTSPSPSKELPPSPVRAGRGFGSPGSAYGQPKRHKKGHERKGSVDMLLETIREGDGASAADEKRSPLTSVQQRMSASAPLPPPSAPMSDQAAAPKNSQFSIFTFKRRSTTPAASVPASPGRSQQQSEEDALRAEAIRRESNDLRAEEDVDVLRERAVKLLQEREAIRCKTAELKQLLTQMQAEVQTDDGITKELVTTKLALADSEYKRLELQLSLHVERNRTRLLSAKVTSLGVQRDLLANKLPARAP